MSHERLPSHTVTPLWPPTTGIVTEVERELSPSTSETNAEARTTSKVVTPKSLDNISHVQNPLTKTRIHTLFWIKNTMLFEYLGNYGDGRIDWI
jgi:hypothetical protein